MRSSNIALRRKNFVTALWLLPAAPARDFFRATIDRLARDYDAPRFEPHLTLGLLETSSALPQLRSASAIRLRPIGILFSSVFTQTLFVRFEMAPALDALRQSLGIRVSGYDPHLSLLYRRLPAAVKERLAASIPLPFSTVVFDQISLVRCARPTESRADVEAWEHLESNKLAARPSNRRSRQ